MGYISKMPQHGAQVCRGMPSWYYLQMNICMPMSSNGILFVGTWVSIQSIDISINLINLMNNVKIIFM
jgi:hypothetical protein